MTMGFPGVDAVRNTDLKECQEILDVFFDHGHTELDTARVYGSGTTEQVRTLQTLEFIALNLFLA